MLSLAIAEWKGKMPAKALMRPVFATRAVKLNHADCQKSLADLNSVLVERPSHSVLFRSSTKTSHVIPPEIVKGFADCRAMFQDFVIMTALNTKRYHRGRKFSKTPIINLVCTCGVTARNQVCSFVMEQIV
jgi:hypothetical protein